MARWTSLTDPPDFPRTATHKILIGRQYGIAVSWVSDTLTALDFDRDPTPPRFGTDLIACTSPGVAAFRYGLHYDQ